MTSMLGKSVHVLLAFTLCVPSFAASTGTHTLAARTAARLAPEPFRSNWDKCRGAAHPDYMSDQPVGHENARLAGLLYTLEAIRYLRKGQINKAMMTASARTHYISDSACIPHAKVWRPREENDLLRPGWPASGVFGFLPARYQDYWLPFGDHIPERHYAPLLIEEPPVFADRWKALEDIDNRQSMHAFFDRISCRTWHPDGFPVEGIPEAENWSAYDREFYARWRAECIALDILDRATALGKTKPLRFAPEAQFKAVMDEEMRNMITAKIAYYRYLTVAASTELRGDIIDIFPSKDPLRLMSQRNPRICIGESAPWPLKRAAYLLAMELVRAKYRYEGRYNDEFAANLRTETDALFDTVELPEEEASRRLIISWQEDAEKVKTSASLPLAGNVILTERGKQRAGHIVLHGKDLQSTIHLIDYLLDLTYAPLNGRTPVEVLLTVFEREWAGTAFLEELRKVSDGEVFDHPELVRPKNIHAEDREEWTDKVHWLVWPNVEGESNLAGPLPAIWNLFLLDLPLPDGSTLDLTK